MTDCVVDANVVLKWFVHQPDSERALEAIELFDFLAPDIILAEVANALWKYVRVGTLSENLANRILFGLENNYVFVDPIDEDLALSAFGLAVRAEHPIYDCLYVALAQRMNVPFLTADRRLSNRIKPLEVVEVIDLGKIEPKNT